MYQLDFLTSVFDFPVYFSAFNLIKCSQKATSFYNELSDGDFGALLIYVVSVLVLLIVMLYFLHLDLIMLTHCCR